VGARPVRASLTVEMNDQRLSIGLVYGMRAMLGRVEAIVTEDGGREHADEQR
jgi:hypothetical protein